MANNCKITPKQKRFLDHYCSDRRNGLKYFVITLADSAEILKELRFKIN